MSKRGILGEGRPSKYRPEYCEGVVEHCTKGFSLTGYAGLIGVSREVLHDWQRAHPEFKDAVDRAKAARGYWWEQRAIDIAVSGAQGAGQANIIMFGLRNHAPEDYQDKQQHEHSGSLTVVQAIEAAAARRAAAADTAGD